MGNYPVKQYRSLSGAVVRRVFGNKQVNYQLDLEFKNIGDTNELKQNSGSAVQIIDHYNDVYGTSEGFNIEPLVFDGMSGQLKSRTQTPHNKIIWHYAEPPDVKSVRRNISTVTVKLVGELDV